MEQQPKRDMQSSNPRRKPRSKIQTFKEAYLPFLIFIAGVSNNSKYRNISYKNSIYVITDKWNPDLIDFYTNKRDNYDYNEFNSYSSIVNLWIHEQFNMDFITIDLIEEEKRGFAN